MRKFFTVLLTLNVVLLLALPLFGRRRQCGDVPPRPALELSSLELNGGALVLERSGDRWQLVRPIRWPANSYFAEFLADRRIADPGGELVPVPVEDLMDRRLCRLNVHALQRLVLSSSDRDFILEKNRGSWEFFSPPAAMADREGIADFLTRIGDLRWEKWSADGPPDGEPILEMILEDALQSERMQFFRCGEKIVLFLDGCYRFELAQDSWKDLMASFARCRSRRLFPRDDCHSLTCDLAGEHFTLQRTFDLPDRWGIIAQADGRFDFYEGDPIAIGEFFDRLDRVEVLRFVCDGGSSETFYGYNFDRPLAIIDWDGRAYRFVRRDGTTFVLDERRGAIYEIGLPGWLEIHGTMFRKRTLLRLPDSADLLAASLTFQRRTVQLPGPMLERIRQFLSPLEVERYLSLSRVPADDPYELVLTCRGSDGDDRLRFLIYRPQGPELTVLWSDRNVLFIPSPSDCRLFLDLIRTSFSDR